MSEQERAQQTTRAAVAGTQPNNSQKARQNTVRVMESSAKHDPTVGDQDRHDRQFKAQRKQASNEQRVQRTTGDVVRGTRPNNSEKAQKNTERAMKSSADHQPKEVKLRAAQVTSDVGIRGTQSSGKYDQKWHDDTFKKNIAEIGSKHGKGSPYNDIEVSQNMLKQGADPKKLMNSIEKNSPNFKKNENRKLGANKIVSVAMKRNAEDVPRPSKQREHPSHKVAEARQNTSNVMASRNSSSSEYNKNIYNMQRAMNERSQKR